MGTHRRSVVTGAVLAVLLAGASLAPAGAAPAGPAAPAGSVRYIVSLDDGLGDVAAVATGLLGALGIGEVVDTYEHALDGFVVDLPRAVLPVLLTLPGVAGVEADRPVRLAESQPDPPYGLDRIDQRDGLSGTYEYSATGEGVTAYVIDSGIRASHEDFSGRVSAGTSTVEGSPLEDCDGHGTHVAGTLGGETHGVAKDVELVSVRVFGCEDTTPISRIIAGVDWVVGEHEGGPAVANLSVGGGRSTVFDAAVQAMIDDGVSTAIAAGNDGTNACSTSPAAVTDGIVVGATDAADRRAPFSNSGPCVDLHAPGVDVVSAGRSSDTATATGSGTSMATPHVAGAAALLLEDDGSMSPADVHEAIVDGATLGTISGVAGSCNLLQRLLGTCVPASPNRLLYTGDEGPDDPPDPPPAPAPCNVLQRLLGLC